MIAKGSGRHAVLISRVYGSRHGGSIYSEALVKVLLGQGWMVTFASEQFDQSIAATEQIGNKQLTLPFFFKSGFITSFSRLVDMIRLTRYILFRRVTLIIVQGDLPRVTYVLLQYLIPLLFIRQDGILTCPANDRFLNNSRTICRKQVGFSCMSIHREEKCFGSLGPFHRIGRIIYRLRDRFLLNMLINFAVNSQYILRTHRRYGVVLYPPCLSATATFANPQRDLHRLVFCGRLERVKGAEDAIHILSRLPKTYRMDVLGNGNDLNSLQATAHTLGVSDRVEFHGWVGRDRRDAVFASSGVLMMPSLCDEAFGMVGIEAFAKGTPVVAYDVGGISEWCKPTAGILVKCGDLDGFAEAIGIITANYDQWRRFSVAAESIAESRFTLSEFQHKARELINDGVSGGLFHS